MTDDEYPYTDEEIRDMCKVLPLGVFNKWDLLEIFDQNVRTD